MMKNFFLFACAALAATFCTEINSFAIGNRYYQKSATLFPNLKQIHAFREYALLMSAADNETDIDDTDAVASTMEDDVVTVDAEDVTNEIEEEEPVVVELDPYSVAVKDLEAQLKIDISLLEASLKSDRNSLSKTKDKASESGKNGYFIVQAKVAEYQKNKAVEQKLRVTKNKREFVMKMLPVVDAFRAAPIISPSTTDREISMHKSFGSLLESILVVFEKYGFKEYDAEIGAPLVPSRHQVSEVIDGEVDGIVASQSKRGILDKDGEVLRRALVVATKAPTVAVVAEVVGAESTEDATQVEEEEEK